MSSGPDIRFEPFRLKSLALKNRIVMAPMTRSFAGGGLPGAAHVDYYRKRAEGQVGLILSEGVVIELRTGRRGRKPLGPGYRGGTARASR